MQDEVTSRDCDSFDMFNGRVNVKVNAGYVNIIQGNVLIFQYEGIMRHIIGIREMTKNVDLQWFPELVAGSYMSRVYFDIDVCEMGRLTEAHYF